MRLRKKNLAKEKVGDFVRMSNRLGVVEERTSKGKQRYGLQQSGYRRTGCLGLKKEHCTRNIEVGQSVT